jgi:hypothetical protein
MSTILYNCNLLCLSISVFIDFIFSWKLLRSKSSNVLDCCVKNLNLASFWVDFLFHSLECVFNCSFIYDTCKRNLLFSACKTFIRLFVQFFLAGSLFPTGHERWCASQSFLYLQTHYEWNRKSTQNDAKFKFLTQQSKTLDDFDLNNFQENIKSINTEIDRHNKLQITMH